MISNLIIGAMIELLGALFMVYHISQGELGEHWPWALAGLVVMIAGMILLYAAFRPVVM